MRYERLAVSLAAISCFGCSRTPTTSQTEEPSTPTTSQTVEPSTNHPVLVSLEGRGGTIVIKAGPTPLYSLLTSDGRVVVQDMTLAELAVHNPQLYERVKRAIAVRADASLDRRGPGL